DAVGEAALHAQALFRLHPGIERAQHVLLATTDRAARVHERRAEHVSQRSLLIGQRLAAALLRHRLSQMLRGEPHLLPDLHELVLAERRLGGIGVTGLQRGRAREYALECRAIQPPGWLYG